MGGPAREQGRPPLHFVPTRVCKGLWLDGAPATKVEVSATILEPLRRKERDFGQERYCAGRVGIEKITITSESVSLTTAV